MALARCRTGQASPRDNVVFEAGLFGGALGMRRTFILHARGAKLPTDLLGLTSIRYDPDTTPVIVRRSISSSARRSTPKAASAGSRETGGSCAHRADRARAVRDLPSEDLQGSDGGARDRRALMGRGRHAVGPLLERGVEGALRTRQSSTSGKASVRATRMRRSSREPARSSSTVDRANGYFTTRSDGPDAFHAQTSGIYLRADPGDMAVLDVTMRPNVPPSSIGVSRSGVLANS